MPNRDLAMRSAALNACLELQSIHELDENFQPVGKDGAGFHFHRHNNQTNSDKEKSAGYETSRPGTTKRRQYYYKQVADCLNSEKSESPAYFLYSLKMKLTCAIPEDQNTRGRKIYSPEDATQRFGILVLQPIPAISQFPIYTRSGEVFLSTQLLQEGVRLTEEEKDLILTFHDYTFSKVLRLVKYPMLFAPDQAEKFSARPSVEN